MSTEEKVIAFLKEKGHNPKNQEDVRKIVKEHPEYVEDIKALVKEDKEQTYHCQAPKRSTVSFSDIAGMDNVKAQLIEFIQTPILFPVLYKGIAQNGILLYGPPGVGKTFIIDALIGEMKNSVYLIAPKPGEIKGKYVGETEKNISAVFKCARDQIKKEGRHVIIMFDEFDSLAKSRAESSESANSVNTILQEFGGLGSKEDEKLIVIGITNIVSSLDEAIIRRFASRIYVPLPDLTTITRQLIIKMKKRYFDFFGKLDGDWGYEINKKDKIDITDPNGILSVGLSILKKWCRNPFTLANLETLATSLKAGGYSNSDIDKIWDLAIKKSLRPLLSNKVDALDVFPFKDGEYYIYTDNDPEAKEMPISKIRNKLFTFEFSLSQFQEAMKEYPRTVKDESQYKINNA